MKSNDKTKPLAVARAVLARNLSGEAQALTSVCSAHPLALRAALSAARAAGQITLVEATCNQVNQYGGYTGMTPADFVAMVHDAAADEHVPPDTILLGGDHLGPQPWRDAPAEVAMAKARMMVDAYVRAGFAKIHLDCSMRCADDPDILPESVIAERAATLAVAAENATSDVAPIYVIGTEVPPPGGMGEGHAIIATDPDHVAATWEAHRIAFDAVGLGEAFARVCAIVVQPGLDFGNETVVHFDASAARRLSTKVTSLSGAVFEAHSTDYQRPQAYSDLVRGHFAILKVGPAATFAVREATYGLNMLAAELEGDDWPDVRDALDSAMLDNPRHWTGHYAPAAPQLARLRHYSWSDRIRYYWTVPSVQKAVTELFTRLDATNWPLPLVSQYLPQQYDAIADAKLAPRCDVIVKDFVVRALSPYYSASRPHPLSGKEP
ncbi:class II D-tagatose-bisphosphate aldolase, non-catalytic subunit [Devosia algicola]|uniref:Class II D-tagatose-bisphosphate aldolase, non-catalytic subunit n=1 Tax=Devosia algicola TaxID=3026418 RepID=A0ABY7YJ91_9HYPH|nr:class II D-tagatose-bisphosphate aldolase, non-catalytic subunit [Devosia algicola]WDR01336.1 class II D-tagatose-bisphosphate aldolase, non-catalytic subunit [Devosia algicola]